MEARNARKAAIFEIAERHPRKVDIDYTHEPIAEVFGCYVFSERVMRERLPARRWTRR